jgi:hypothetical protein
MAMNFLRKASPAMPRESHPPQTQPPNPSRASTADEGHSGFGENPPNRSRDLHISARQPPCRSEPSSSSRKEPSGTSESPTNDRFGLKPFELSHEEHLETSEEPQTLWHPSKPPRDERRLHVDLPPPKQEGDGHTTRGIITSSPGNRSQRRFGQWGLLPAKASTLTPEGKIPTAHIKPRITSSMHPSLRPIRSEGMYHEDREESQNTTIVRRLGRESIFIARQLTLSLKTYLTVEEIYNDTST